MRGPRNVAPCLLKVPDSLTACQRLVVEARTSRTIERLRHRSYSAF
jgi:hypothetical protein